MLDKSSIEYWVFDLDNTLYPSENNLFSQIDKRMGNFISRQFDLPLGEAKALQKKYFQTYGTTLRGLMTEHDIPPQDFLTYVHDIDFDVLDRNDALRQAINSLDGVKVIYTNASRDYAEKVMEKIGIAGLFEDIFDITSAGYIPKPDPRSYHKMIREMNIDPSRSVMVEDIARNLVPASDMGMKTVWVPTGHEWSGAGASAEHIDFTAPDLVAWLKSLVED
ncbi:MAG: pyrimidine 5'-nucleotidase [Alphaproteobacteria bacterium]|nr:MAG: pyrimidine 5'-nucleotidase [Alphaproteobacteria bacterium]